MADSTDAAPEPATATRLAGDDALYRDWLADLEVGRLDPERIGVLGTAARSRLVRAFGEPVADTLDPCTSVFAIYGWRVHDANTIKKHGAKLAKAAQRLADALAATGRSEAYRLLDPGVFDFVPNDYIGTNPRVEDYLREFADHFQQLDDNELAAWSHLVPTRFSANLSGFIIEYVDEWLDHLWRRGDLFEPPFNPDDSDRRPHRMHQAIADVCSVLLAAGIASDSVNEQLKRQAKRQSNSK